MPGASPQDKAELRALLNRASIELANTMSRLDDMGDFELAEIKGAAGGLVAFFDKNGQCGSAGVGATVNRPLGTTAFFDKNGQCGSAGDIRGIEELARAIRNVVRTGQ